MNSILKRKVIFLLSSVFLLILAIFLFFGGKKNKEVSSKEILAKVQNYLKITEAISFNNVSGNGNYISFKIIYPEGTEQPLKSILGPYFIYDLRKNNILKVNNVKVFNNNTNIGTENFVFGNLYYSYHIKDNKFILNSDNKIYYYDLDEKDKIHLLGEFHNANIIETSLFNNGDYLYFVTQKLYDIYGETHNISFLTDKLIVFDMKNKTVTIKEVTDKPYIFVTKYFDYDTKKVNYILNECAYESQPYNEEVDEDLEADYFEFKATINGRNVYTTRKYINISLENGKIVDIQENKLNENDIVLVSTDGQNRMFKVIYSNIPIGSNKNGYYYVETTNYEIYNKLTASGDVKFTYNKGIDKASETLIEDMFNIKTFVGNRIICSADNLEGIIKIVYLKNKDNSLNYTSTSVNVKHLVDYYIDKETEKILVVTKDKIVEKELKLK